MRLLDSVTRTVREISGRGPGESASSLLPPGLRAVRDGNAVWVFFRGETYRLERVVARPSAAAPPETEHDLAAPMPGKIVALLVKDGDAVVKGATLLILEAMKMEYPVRAPRTGIVTRLSAAEGAMVSLGQRLLEIE